MIIKIENSFYNSDNIVKVELTIPKIKIMLNSYNKLVKYTNFHTTSINKIDYEKTNFYVQVRIYCDGNKDTHFHHYFNLLNDDEIAMKRIKDDNVTYHYPIIPDEELTDYLNKAIDKVHNELSSLHKFLNN